TFSSRVQTFDRLNRMMVHRVNRLRPFPLIKHVLMRRVVFLLQTTHLLLYPSPCRPIIVLMSPLTYHLQHFHFLKTLDQLKNYYGWYNQTLLDLEAPSQFFVAIFAVGLMLLIHLQTEYFQM